MQLEEEVIVRPEIILVQLEDLVMLYVQQHVIQLLLADMASLKDRDARYRAAARRAGVTGEKKAKLEGLLKKRNRLERGIERYALIREYCRRWHGMHKAFSYLFFIALTLHIVFELVW